MFTRKQIEEIAAKLAELSKKDSQFYGAITPFDSSERWPILQDGENRLMTFGQLQSILINGNKSGVQCTLNVSCSTEDSVIKINGYPTNTITTGYGEMVLVVVSAEGYDTWYEVITMTDDFDINVVLNKTGSDTPGPGPTPTQQFSVCINSVKDQSTGLPIDNPVITFNGEAAAVGETKIFSSAVHISVTKDGYQDYSNDVSTNTELDVMLPPESSEDITPHIEFVEEIATISASGEETKTIHLNANIPWILYESTLPSEETAPEPGENTTDGNTSSTLPGNIKMTVGDADVDLNNLNN